LSLKATGLTTYYDLNLDYVHYDDDLKENVTITKINYLMLFKEIIAVYSETAVQTVEIAGTYNYHLALKG
jgi:hypothetical protein